MWSINKPIISAGDLYSLLAIGARDLYSLLVSPLLVLETHIVY